MVAVGRVTSLFACSRVYAEMHCKSSFDNDPVRHNCTFGESTSLRAYASQPFTFCSSSRKYQIFSWANSGKSSACASPIKWSCSTRQVPACGASRRRSGGTVGGRAAPSRAGSGSSACRRLRMAAWRTSTSTPRASSERCSFRLRSIGPLLADSARVRTCICEASRFGTIFEPTG